MRLKIFSCMQSRSRMSLCCLRIAGIFEGSNDYLKTGIDNNIHGFNFAAISHCKFLQTQCI